MFDHATGRCYDCDGHYTHRDCPTYPDAAPSVLTVAQRVAIYAEVAR